MVESSETAGKIKIANRLRWAELIRVVRGAFIISFATSQGGVKGINFIELIRRGGLTIFAPSGTVLDDPIGQRLLKTDITPGFFRFNPFVTENFFALGLKLAVER